MRKATVALLLLGVLVSGCSTPRTRLSIIDPSGAKLNLDAPKDTTIKNFKAKYRDLEISFDEYKARMNPEVISAQGERESNNIRNTGSAAGQIIGEGAKAFVKP